MRLLTELPYGKQKHHTFPKTDTLALQFYYLNEYSSVMLLHIFMIT